MATCKPRSLIATDETWQDLRDFAINHRLENGEVIALGLAAIQTLKPQALAKMIEDTRRPVKAPAKKQPTKPTKKAGPKK